MNIICCKKCNNIVSVYFNKKYIHLNILFEYNSYVKKHYLLCTDCFSCIADNFYIYCKNCNRKPLNNDKWEIFNYLKHIYVNENFNEINDALTEFRCNNCLQKSLTSKTRFFQKRIHIIC